MSFKVLHCVFFIKYIKNVSRLSDFFFKLQKKQMCLTEYAGYAECHVKVIAKSERLFSS